MSFSDQPVTVAPRSRASERILRAARDLFYRCGIRAIGVDEIVHTAQVTKPSLYRAFESKDGLAEAYLSAYQCEFWDRIEVFRQRTPDDPRAVLEAYFDNLAQRASAQGYRGCALSNALVEYPQPEHPLRMAAMDLKQKIRAWMVQQACALGARDPAVLADGLLLVMEGCYGAGQAFAPSGPATLGGRLARTLIAAHCDNADNGLLPVLWTAG